jgi:hypothetical protein
MSLVRARTSTFLTDRQDKTHNLGLNIEIPETGIYFYIYFSAEHAELHTVKTG